MDNLTPTEKAVAMAQRMEELEEWNKQLIQERNTLNRQHEHEIRVQEAYVAGIKATLEALLNRSINL